ncbi:hypothetical protein [Streptomyces chartreusis]|uniref:hypothetical protein n=1 Tax=Streptomyces chartreusis TaxID=1969 RepID=UPI00167B52EE|nr:hypothetical protein [Streptomyces chartreusis]GGX56049.1 hypothetical protein GCM10010321_86640 [Streptomyces chartreusis]
MRTPRNRPDEAAAPTELRTLFTITSYDRQDAKLYSTLPIFSADTAARWHDQLADDAATHRITIVANTIMQAMRLITVGELPGPGAPTPQPALPEDAHTALRYYRFSSGPSVLRTGDDARFWLKQTTEAQQHPTVHTVPVDLAQLQLFEVVRTEHARMITYAELADLA